MYTTNRAHAIWHLDPHKSELREVSLDPNLNLVQSLYSLVSIGTERLVATGQVPEEAYQAMRVPYMLGSFELPCCYGYSLVGRELQSNKLVHLMHPHQTYAAVAGHDLFFIDDDQIPGARLTLLSNMETAVTIFWDSGPVKEKNILILGAGLIGLLTATLLARENIPFEIRETNAARSEKAASLGFDRQKKNESYDLIIDTTGNPAALPYAIEHATKNGRIVVVGWLGTKKTEINLGGAFHYNRLTIKSSQVSMIPPHMEPEWDYFKRKRLCLKLLKNDFYDQLIDHVVEFQDLPYEFTRIRKGNYPYLSLIVKY